ncbi:caspase recruitment domain-containing protein 11-like isoform X3 [Antedon mediterranea]|uniref:caspase recruitment domain-containing protein 11-like isoform X3 n=1 Tax=Antedon mediterranea TaxID=105859 RepID=UPI003AF9EB31
MMRFIRQRRDRTLSSDNEMKESVEDAEYEDYRVLLEDNRESLVKDINVSDFFFTLRSESIFDMNDEQSITQNLRLSTDKEKAGAFLDKLATKGKMGFKVFLGILETRYPELYKQLSGKEPVSRGPEGKPLVGETCRQHQDLIKNLAFESAKMASKVESYKNENENLIRKVNELQRYNDILKMKHNKNMIKLQRFDELQQAIAMSQHELNDLTTQQRNILAKSLQLQQEKEAIQRRLRSSNVEITDLKRQLEGYKEHQKIQKEIIKSSRNSKVLTRSPSIDLTRSMEMEIERLRRELAAYTDSKGVDVEVAILRDDLRDKTAECEHLAEEWQHTQKELNTAEEERITAMSDLEDVRFTCQNFEREAIRYKQLHELNIKHSDRTEEDLKKVREDRNSLETHIDSLLREQRDLLYKVQELHNKNMTLVHEKSVLTKAINCGTAKRKKGVSPDLGYAGGSQSGSSKGGSPRNSMDDKSTAESTGTVCSNPKLHLNIGHTATDSEPSSFRKRSDAIGACSPIARSPLRSGNIYATLQRKTICSDIDESVSMPDSSCSSIESLSDKDSDVPSTVPARRPHIRSNRGADNLSMDVNPGSTRNRFTLTCFGGKSFDIREENKKEIIDEDEEEDPYDYPEVYKRRSMSLTDLNLLSSANYDFVDISKPKNK